MTLKIKKKKRLQQNGVGMLREKQGYYLSLLPLTLSVTKKTHNPKLGIFFYMKFKIVPGKQ